MYDTTFSTAGTTARRAGSYASDRRADVRMAALRAARLRLIRRGAAQISLGLVSLAAGIALAYSPLAGSMPAFASAASVVGVIAGIMLGVIGARKVQFIWL